MEKTEHKASFRGRLWTTCMVTAVVTFLVGIGIRSMKSSPSEKPATLAKVQKLIWQIEDTRATLLEQERRLGIWRHQIKEALDIQDGKVNDSLPGSSKPNWEIVFPASPYGVTK